MRLALRFSIPILFLCLPAFAADPIFGVWKMRDDPQNPAMKSQQMKVEEVSGGARFSFDIVMAKSRISYFYVTKLDGEAVSAIMKKKPFSKVSVKKISPFLYETAVMDLTTEQHFTSTISKDGKILTNQGTGQANGQSIVVHLVFDKVQ